MHLEFWKIIDIEMGNEKPLGIAHMVLFTFLALS